MHMKYIFESDRLGFREWTEADKAPFGKMNANEEVMKFFPKLMTQTESDSLVQRINQHFDNNGFGLWAVEVKETNEFIGFIGFLTISFEDFFTPGVEIGWRLDNAFWNKGYATEGAQACLKYGFEILDLSEIYSFTALSNQPSINVMKKIGLKKQDKTFEHPKVEVGSPLREHVLYRMGKDEYKKELGK